MTDIETTEQKAKAKVPRKKAKSKAKAKATKASSKNKKASSKKNKVKKIPKIKIWMMENGINQIELAEMTALSSNTINRFVNKGKATKSVIKLISIKLNISEEMMSELIKDSESITN